MYAFLAKIFTDGFFNSLTGIATKGIDYYLAKANGNVQEAITLMQTEQALISAQKEIRLASMSHPIWWIAWLIFILPLGVYWDKIILWDTVLGWGHTPPLYGQIKDWAGWMVSGIFCLQVGSGLVSSLLNKLIK